MKGPAPVPVTLRFWSKVDQSAGPFGCWPWTGSTARTGGYGKVSGVRPRSLSAHRVAYELSVGPIPAGLTLDHLCRNPSCVNPAHLEAVTMRENILRGTSPAAVAARQTACVNGHDFTPENTYRARGKRHCRACHRERNRRWYAGLGRLAEART